ncbi:MAG TPA: aldo/keto reductase [Trueperaceae bacterium]
MPVGYSAVQSVPLHDQEETALQYRKLGTTDIDVSTICLGCYVFEGGMTWGDQREDDSIATIEAALDAGINFFDTAEAYGDGFSEELLGRVLAGRRDETVIATKVSPDHLGSKQVREACERSLRRLRTDYIDLYQVHWPNWQVPMEETIGALEELKREGKVRAVGVSNFGVRDLTDFLEHVHPETNQLPYNLLWRAVEFELIPMCAEENVGVLTYSSLMQGLLTGKFPTADDVPEGRARTKLYSKDRPLSKHGQPGLESETFETISRLKELAEEAGYPLAQLAVAWLLRQPAVTSVLVGARTPEQVRQNAPAADVDAPAELFEQMTAITDELKQQVGSDPDMWLAESRFR